MKVVRRQTPLQKALEPFVLLLPTILLAAILRPLFEFVPDSSNALRWMMTITLALPVGVLISGAIHNKWIDRRR